MELLGYFAWQYYLLMAGIMFVSLKVITKKVTYDMSDNAVLLAASVLWPFLIPIAFIVGAKYGSNE